MYTSITTGVGRLGFGFKGDGARSASVQRLIPRVAILRTCRAADGDKELAKQHRAGRAAAAASAQWQRSSIPCPPWVHDGYFAPAPRYGAQVALARTLR